MKRRGFTTGWKRAAATAVVAYALVLQALLLSFGGALHAAEASGPQAVICAEGVAGPDHAPAKAHDGLCCTLSCHGAGPAGPLPGFTLLERLAPVAGGMEPSSGPPVLAASSDVLPLGSRAPPRLG
jgi:hypothetical protein